MFVFGNLLYAFAVITDFIVNALLIILIIRVLISWFPIQHQYNPVIRKLKSLTDPSLNFIRYKLKLNVGVVDLSPIIIILFLYFVKLFFIQTLFDLANRLQG